MKKVRYEVASINRESTTNAPPPARKSLDERLRYMLHGSKYFLDSLQGWQVRHVVDLMKSAYNMGRRDAAKEER